MSVSRAWYVLSGDDVAQELTTDLTRGLCTDEVARRREQSGWNTLAEAPPVPGWKKLLGQFKELVIWILIVAAIISGVMGEWADTAAIMAIVLVNGIIGFLQEEKAAVEQRPDVSAAAARTQAEQVKFALAYKQYYPDAELFGRYDTFWQPRDTQSDLRGQVGARINVPIYRDRLNAAVCEAMHQVTKARAEYDQLVLEVQSDVQSAFEQVRESQRTVALYSQKLVPIAEQIVGVAQSNYDTSKITFLELAISQRQLIEARERQLQTQVELQRRTATLRRVSGGSLPDAPSPVPPPEP